MDSPLHSSHGVHYLLECSGCMPELLESAPLLEKTMEQAARSAGATVVKTVIHGFNPIGLSGVVIIAESHIAIHCWPEQAYAAIDIFTCGDAKIAERIYQNILTAFEPHSHSCQKLERRPPAVTT
ncbi:adenosylmethionine decarboxylase [Rubritalea spongiae]|uniref:S-adenosylmethionine decarboxylase proenzyme n=1 Tax=Rubritalea spongiae TaxID=430797 RepID=A0ABW5E3E5_9BACT